MPEPCNSLDTRRRTAAIHHLSQRLDTLDRPVLVTHMKHGWSIGYRWQRLGTNRRGDEDQALGSDRAGCEIESDPPTLGEPTKYGRTVPVHPG